MYGLLAIGAAVLMGGAVATLPAFAQQGGEIPVLADQPEAAAPIPAPAEAGEGTGIATQPPSSAPAEALSADGLAEDTPFADGPSGAGAGAEIPPPPSEGTLAETFSETATDETAAPDPVEAGNVEEHVRRQVAVHEPAIDPARMRSLFFTQWEHDLMIQARAGLFVRPPESPITEPESPAIAVPGAPGPRELALSGIMYRSKDSWTFWLNGMRITPTAIPEQIMDLKVARDHIQIEWLDTQTNQIYPIRLRPHQRFNLDSRIFLPGELPGGGG